MKSLAELAAIREKMQSKVALREGTSRIVPKWIALDSENLKATITDKPARDDIDLTIQENLIVELYSR